MLRTIVVLCVLCVAGCCDTPEERAARAKAKAEAAEKAQAEFNAKVESIKNKKIVNIRVTGNTVDIVTEEGKLYTITSHWQSRGNGNYESFLTLE